MSPIPKPSPSPLTLALSQPPKNIVDGVFSIPPYNKGDAHQLHHADVLACTQMRAHAGSFHWPSKYEYRSWRAICKAFSGVPRVRKGSFDKGGLGYPELLRGLNVATREMCGALDAGFDPGWSLWTLDDAHPLEERLPRPAPPARKVRPAPAPPAPAHEEVHCRPLGQCYRLLRKTCGWSRWEVSGDLISDKYSWTHVI